jgi:hypothetical protein
MKTCWNLFKIKKLYQHSNRKYILRKKIFGPNEIKRLSNNEPSFLHTVLYLVVFLSVTFNRSRHICLYVEQTSCSHFLQLRHSIQSSSLVLLWAVFPALTAFHFIIFSFPLTKNIHFYWLLFCFLFWPCRPEIFRLFTLSIPCSLTLYPFCFFHFSSILLASSVI